LRGGGGRGYSSAVDSRLSAVLRCCEATRNSTERDAYWTAWSGTLQRRLVFDLLGSQLQDLARRVRDHGAGADDGGGSVFVEEVMTPGGKPVVSPLCSIMKTGCQIPLLIEPLGFDLFQ
jgi:hypothetical protein